MRTSVVLIVNDDLSIMDVKVPIKLLPIVYDCVTRDEHVSTYLSVPRNLSGSFDRGIASNPGVACNLCGPSDPRRVSYEG